MIALLRRLFGRDATTCRCGHDAAVHEHWRAGSDCGTCGKALCPRFRARPWRDTPVDDPDEVRRDDQALNAVAAGDLDTARRIAPDVVDLLASPEFTHALLTSWANNGAREGRRTA